MDKVDEFACAIVVNMRLESAGRESDAYLMEILLRYCASREIAESFLSTMRDASESQNVESIAYYIADARDPLLIRACSCLSSALYYHLRHLCTDPRFFVNIDCLMRTINDIIDPVIVMGSLQLR